MFGRFNCASRADNHRDVLSALQHTESALTWDPRAAVMQRSASTKPGAPAYGVHFHLWGAAELSGWCGRLSVSHKSNSSCSGEMADTSKIARVVESSGLACHCNRV